MREIQQDVIHDIAIWIEENVHRPLKISEIAQRSGYSIFYIQRLFYKYTGVTLAKHVRELKLHYAAEALSNTDEPIAEIALKLGYEGQQTFTRSFTRHYSIPPGKFRRRARLYLSMSNKKNRKDICARNL